MTTHVFIVDKTTFKCHLNYMFVGIGAKDKDVDFNNNSNSLLYPHQKHAAEAVLVYMMADCSRVRRGDLVIFYLQAVRGQEGRFFGVFQIIGDPFLEQSNKLQYLRNDLGKNLTFRIRIAPYEVYKKGVTEWKALDEIRHISSPCQMLWSLIYRKLKGNRGCTMITIYESERLIDLIRRENNNKYLQNVSNYTYDNGEIKSSIVSYRYTGSSVPFNILPRLIQKHIDRKSYEAHLQMYIIQNIGRNISLDNALGIVASQIEWIGNEVSCGVGMQRIDVMISKIQSQSQRLIMPIELKAVQASNDNIKQLNRYIDWIEQYYIPNRMSTIQPVLICKAGGMTSQLRGLFNSFNTSANGRYLPLMYIEYAIKGNNIIFTNLPY